MKNILISTLCAFAVSATAFAAIPDGYYNSLVGKSGDALKEAAKTAGAAGFKIITYGEKTWTAFETTDERDFDQRRIWFDMYSNVIQPIEAGHGGMNIEHSVPNSWWGAKKGSIEAYSDIVHLNPSNADANNRKSAHPLGEISGTPAWTNGISSIGTPTSVTGGGSQTVFEPADEYKGDFARAYFYVFTIYDNIPWEAETAFMYDVKSPLTLKPWAYQMLLDWSAMDPVDSRELKRNDEIYALQGNRNPFIDLPELAEFIWGERASETFAASDIKEPVAVNRPDSPRPVEPAFSVTAVNGYAMRWWNPETISFAPFAEGVTGYYTINGGAPIRFEDSSDPTIELPAAQQHRETMTIQIYCRAVENGLTLDSGVTTLILTARDPEVSDFSDHSWTLVETGSPIDPQKDYIVVSAKSRHVMGAGKGSGNFIVDGGVVTVSDDKIIMLPQSTGIVRFEPSGSDYTIQLNDLTGKSAGYLTTTAAKSMRLTDSGTEASVSVGEDNIAVITFGSLGNLYYNTQSPRFLNYTSSTQESIQLFVSAGELNVGVEEVDSADSSRVRVYDLTGRLCDPDALRPGIYIFVRGTEVTKEVVTR